MAEKSKRRYMNIAEIKQANTAAGRFWFSAETVKAFVSRVETRVFEVFLPDHGDCRLWVESTRTYDETSPKREYKIARFRLEDCDIAYVHDEKLHIYKFDTKREAQSKLYDLLD